MRHIDILPQENPTVVLLGTRMRSSREDFAILEWHVYDLPRPTVFRVSGMITGPEEFIERIAPRMGHRVEVWSQGPDTPAHRTCKRDTAERDAASLLGAHALWVWPFEHRTLGRLVADDELVVIAQELGLPVFMFLSAHYNYEVVEL